MKRIELTILPGMERRGLKINMEDQSDVAEVWVVTSSCAQDVGCGATRDAQG